MGVATIVPPELCARSQAPAATTGALSRRAGGDSVRASRADGTATASTTRTARATESTATGTTVLRRDVRQASQAVFSSTPRPRAATTENTAPRSRSNRCGKPSAAVRLPAYITRHQASTVTVARTGAGLRSYLSVSTSRASPNTPSQMMGAARAENRCSGAGTDWLPSTWDTAADEAE